MSDLQRAIEVAVVAHRGQHRKDGSPYILHPLRLMMAVESTHEKIVAVLHDVVEDTEVSMEDMKKEGFDDEILVALDLVTHDDDTPYDDYIQKIKTNALASAVKMADLRDNSNLFEVPNVGPKDLKRVEKYHRAYKTLADG